jgi:hypothetical protein
VLTYMNVPASPELPVPPPQIASVLFNFSPKAYQRKTPVASASTNAHD